MVIPSLPVLRLWNTSSNNTQLYPDGANRKQKTQPGKRNNFLFKFFDNIQTYCSLPDTTMYYL